MKTIEERILETLKAKLLVDRDVMEANEIEDLEEQIKVVEKHVNAQYTTTKYPVYSESNDMTFIMVDTFKNGEPYSTECVGWYCGEPSEEDNKYFTGKLKGTWEV
jgi:hypothetical protein